MVLTAFSIAAFVLSTQAISSALYSGWDEEESEQQPATKRPSTKGPFRRLLHLEEKRHQQGEQSDAPASSPGLAGPLTVTCPPPSPSSLPPPPRLPRLRKLASINTSHNRRSLLRLEPLHAVVDSTSAAGEVLMPDLPPPSQQVPDLPHPSLVSRAINADAQTSSPENTSCSSSHTATTANPGHPPSRSYPLPPSASLFLGRPRSSSAAVPTAIARAAGSIAPLPPLLPATISGEQRPNSPSRSHSYSRCPSFTRHASSSATSTNSILSSNGNLDSPPPPPSPTLHAVTIADEDDGPAHNNHTRAGDDDDDDEFGVLSSWIDEIECCGATGCRARSRPQPEGDSGGICFCKKEWEHQVRKEQARRLKLLKKQKLTQQQQLMTRGRALDRPELTYGGRRKH